MDIMGRNYIIITSGCERFQSFHAKFLGFLECLCRFIHDFSFCTPILTVITLLLSFLRSIFVYLVLYHCKLLLDLGYFLK